VTAVDPLTVLAMVGAGLTSVTAPCVLPLLPAYVTVVLDAAAGRGRAAVPAAGLRFVAGFTLVFVALGVLAGTAGAELRPWPGAVARGGGAVLVVLGLVLLLATAGRAARRWSPIPQLSLVRALHRVGPGWRPALLGVAFGAAWTPCVGPLLGSALLAAASAGPWRAGLLLAAFSAGLALPFLALCVVAAVRGRAPQAVAARAGRWSVRGQRLAAALVLALGALLATGRGTPFTTFPG